MHISQIVKTYADKTIRNDETSGQPEYQLPFADLLTPSARNPDIGNSTKQAPDSFAAYNFTAAQLPLLMSRRETQNSSESKEKRKHQHKGR